MLDTNLLWKVIHYVALFSSVAAVIVMWNPGRDSYSTLEIILVLVTAVLFFALAISDFRNYLKSRPHRLKSDSDIRDYMYKWIDSGSRVHIFSRDLSWVRDTEMKEMLLKKARSDELNITVPKPVPVLADLRREGAIVNYYPEIDYVPQARFTITNWERADARVAVGRSVKGVHVVEEFSAGEHPVFYVATDLVQMVTRFDDCMKTCRRSLGSPDE